MQTHAYGVDTRTGFARTLQLLSAVAVLCGLWMFFYVTSLPAKDNGVLRQRRQQLANVSAH